MSECRGVSLHPTYAQRGRPQSRLDQASSEAYLKITNLKRASRVAQAQSSEFKFQVPPKKKKRISF